MSTFPDKDLPSFSSLCGPYGYSWSVLANLHLGNTCMKSCYVRESLVGGCAGKFVRIESAALMREDDTAEVPSERVIEGVPNRVL